jgi:hypothetical protein
MASYVDRKRLLRGLSSVGGEGERSGSAVAAAGRGAKAVPSSLSGEKKRSLGA